MLTQEASEGSCTKLTSKSRQQKCTFIKRKDRIRSQPPTTTCIQNKI